MKRRDQDVLFRSTVAVTISIALAMIIVLLIGVWGANRDLSDIRQNLLDSEITHLYSHGLRTVARLESELEQRENGSGLASLQHSWLRTFWDQVVPDEQQRLYAAVVNADADIVMHSDRSAVGHHLPEDWCRDTIPNQADSGLVCHVRDSALTGDIDAIDISIPIVVQDEVVGAYHSGFEITWMEEQIRAAQQPVLHRWILIISTIFVIVLLAALALHRINQRTAALQQAISMGHVKQLSDLGRLVGALAHEIRNPLNAIRLNLHALQNVLLGKGTLPQDEIQQVVEESNREISRLSELMKTMLGYARPEQAAAEKINLNHEIEGTGSFLSPMMQRHEIRFVVNVPSTPILISMDPDRLRQVLLNMLNNARDAAGPGGEVTLTLTSTDEHAVIRIRDNGPGVPPSERERIFGAFYSTKDTGTGLGLALVDRFVEEAGGTVTCEGVVADSSAGGAVFQINLPLIKNRDSA